MEIDKTLLKELVNKTFGQEAANDEEITEFYERVICGIFESVFVVQANYGQDEPSQIVGIALESNLAMSMVKKFETQMRLTKEQPAPFSQKDFEAGNLQDHEVEAFTSWHFEHAKAENFEGCSVQPFQLNKLYDIAEPNKDKFFRPQQVDFKDKPDYLVRPSDYQTFKKQVNGKYRILHTDIPEQRGNEYDYQTLKSHGFFPCLEEELEEVERKSKFMMEYTQWASRPDGHGGSKGGTMEEYREYLKSKGISSTEEF